MAKPSWLKQKLRAEMVGPRKQWGGARPGAGRPREKASVVDLRLNNIQRLSLLEMGNGDIQAGVQALIDKHL